MQAVYFIALFGLVAAIISSFTVGMGANSMQVKESRLEQMQQTFDNLEFAINNVVLKEKTDLHGEIPGLSSGTIINLSENELKNFLPYMRSSNVNLVKDPWRSTIYYYALEKPAVFCSGTSTDAGGEVINDCMVKAPVVYFIMVSAGPNRKHESGPNGDGTITSTDIVTFMNFSKPADSDDIVKVFNTDAPMRAHYNNMVAVDDRVSALILKSYRDQAARFFQTPKVTKYIEEELKLVLGNDGFFPPPPPGGGSSGTPPCTDDCLPFSIATEDIYGKILELDDAMGDGSPGSGWDGYPRMKGTYDGSADEIPVNAYGAESEMQYDPFCAVIAQGGSATNSGCKPLFIKYDKDIPWQVTVNRDLGVDLTGGWVVLTKKTLNGKKEL